MIGQTLHHHIDGCRMKNRSGCSSLGQQEYMQKEYESQQHTWSANANEHMWMFDSIMIKHCRDCSRAYVPACFRLTDRLKPWLTDWCGHVTTELDCDLAPSVANDRTTLSDLSSQSKIGGQSIEPTKDWSNRHRTYMWANNSSEEWRY